MATTAADLAEAPTAPTAPALTKAQARTATAAIKRQLADLQGRSDALLEAIRRARTDGVWSAMGYGSWDDYVRAEFSDLSRGKRHRLSVWAEVVPELEAAAGGPVEVSGREAARARRRGPAAVAEKVRENLADKPDPTGEDRRAAVKAALADPIEATATPVPGGEATDEGAAGAMGDVDEAEQPARARASGEARGEVEAAGESGTAVPMAAELIDRLKAIAPEQAAVDVQLSDLDALNAWVGMTRAAVRRRTVASAPVVHAEAPAPLAPPKAAKAKGCAVHPVNRIVGGVCMACGEPVKQGRQA